MKTVVHHERYSPPGAIHKFPDAGVRLANGVPTQVTDEQAAVLLTNPDVTLVESKPELKAAIVDAKPAVKAAVAAAKADVTEAA